jgi:hypothetical protein
VRPNFRLLRPEDKKAYRQYQREIMARHYFFFIDWPDTSAVKKLFLCLTKPVRAWWLFENLFVKIKDHIPKKKLLVAAQGMLLLSMLFLNNEGTAVTDYLFRILGWIDLCGGLLVTAGTLLCYPLGKHFDKKAKLRHDLVN